jgi:hypothetical protein
MRASTRSLRWFQALSPSSQLPQRMLKLMMRIMAVLSHETGASVAVDFKSKERRFDAAPREGRCD